MEQVDSVEKAVDLLRSAIRDEIAEELAGERLSSENMKALRRGWMADVIDSFEHGESYIVASHMNGNTEKDVNPLSMHVSIDSEFGWRQVGYLDMEEEIMDAVFFQGFVEAGKVVRAKAIAGALRDLAGKIESQLGRGILNEDGDIFPPPGEIWDKFFK